MTVEEFITKLNEYEIYAIKDYEIVFDETPRFIKDLKTKIISINIDDELKQIILN